jgi:hypothetical protein
MTSALSGQIVERAVQVHAAFGGAATGGGSLGNNGGVFGELGVGVSLTPGWGLEIDGLLFARLVNTDCVASPPSCDSSFPSSIRTVAVDVVHRVTLTGSASRPLAFSAGLGPAFVAATNRTSSATAIAVDLGAELTLVHSQRAALTLATKGMLIPNVHSQTLWLIPLTIGARF